jgi:hypothetical protein
MYAKTRTRTVLGLTVISFLFTFPLGQRHRPPTARDRPLAAHAISAIFVMPYYPVWSLIYIVIAVMVIYGLSARYSEQTA